MIYDFVMDKFGVEHLFTVLFIVNFILAAIAYKLGFAKKLPILKSVIIYIILAVGVFFLNILFIVVPAAMPASWSRNPLPITESLIVICAVLAIYRLRLHIQRQAKKAN